MTMDEAVYMSDQGGRRSGIERRQFSYSAHSPERRKGHDRRRHPDRRGSTDRRSGVERRGFVEDGALRDQDIATDSRGQ